MGTYEQLLERLTDEQIRAERAERELEAWQGKARVLVSRLERTKLYLREMIVRSHHPDRDTGWFRRGVVRLLERLEAPLEVEP